ncbi:MAG: hydrogenase expression/formation protein HypE, partial [Proteobacteria bacterium]|nr:hydrogenase expression/formation protein HypE [Pseudomonadota bacterium]
RLMSEVNVIPEALALAQHGATAMHDVTRGGLLETLMEIAQLSEIAIEVEASRLPIPPVVTRFARAFQFDPLRMISSGTVAATVPPEKVGGVIAALNKMGVPVSDVGRVKEGEGVRLFRDDETIHYNEIRCEDDELARMWTLYPRDK